MFGFRPRRARDAWTGTVSSGSGTITAASAIVTYGLDGKFMHFICPVTIATNGSGATNVQFTLPYTPLMLSAISGIDIDTGIALAAYANTDGKVYITKYDGTYPGADAKILRVAGMARIA